MDKIDRILPKLTGVRKAPARAGTTRAYRAFCPVHQPDGKKPGRYPALSAALSVSGGVLFNCYKGCTFNEICDALGERPEDLMPDGGNGPGIPGGPSGWASAAALADAVADAAADVTVGNVDAYAVLASAVERFRAAARAAIRGGAV